MSAGFGLPETISTLLEVNRFGGHLIVTKQEAVFLGR
jgi:hypothetical protein